MIVGPSGVGKSSLINALRSNSSDVAEGENWFEPVGFLCFILFFSSTYERLIFVSPVNAPYFSDFGKQVA